MGDEQKNGALVLRGLEPLLVDADDAAVLVRLSRAMFFKCLAGGRIGPTPIRFGKALRFSVAELRDWAAAGCPDRAEWARIRDRGAAR